jgi:hypothetical protein
VEKKYEFDCPYFELGNTLDVIPDAGGARPDKGLGVFWVTMESPHTVAAWKADKSYKNIDQALLSPGQRQRQRDRLGDGCASCAATPSTGSRTTASRSPASSARCPRARCCRTDDADRRRVDERKHDELVDVSWSWPAAWW